MAPDSRYRAGASRAARATCGAPPHGSSAAPPGRAGCDKSRGDRRHRTPWRMVSQRRGTIGGPAVLPSKDKTVICFAHVAYQLQTQFVGRDAGIASFEVRSAEELERRLAEADVLVISGLWRDALVKHAQ